MEGCGIDEARFRAEGFPARVEDAVSYLRKRLSRTPDVCIILGTGLGGVADALQDPWTAAYSDIPHFPASTSPSHAGRLLVGTIGHLCVAVFQGRFHYYEGYSTRELTLPIRVMSLLGARVLIGCNAAGGLNPVFSSGDIMLVSDHINLIPDNPLRGPNVEEWGLRFPDLSRAYSKRLRAGIRLTADRLGIGLREGVYVAVPGPSLETPAETRFLRLIGADAVAMSLVPEVIVAVHAGMEVLGISVIANVNDPDAFQPIRIEDVVANAKKAEAALSRLIVRFLEEADSWMSST
ncbi:MAG: purine-nucleoside phosphorylase [Deltaproteobacteria bacterium]